MLAAYRDRLWIIRQAVALRPFLCAATLAAVLVSAALPLGSIAATAALIGAIPAAVADGFESPAGAHATHALALFAVLMVASRIVTPLRQTLGTALKLALDAHFQQRVMRAVAAPAGIAHLEDPATLDRITMAQGIGSARYTPGDVVLGFVDKLPTLIHGYGAALIVARFQWWLAVLLLLAWTWATTTGRREILEGAAVATRVSRALRRSVYLRDLALRPAAARELRIFGLAGWLLDRFSAEAYRAIEPIWQKRRRGNQDLLLSALPLVLVQSGAYALVGWAGARGEVTLAELSLYVGGLTGIGALANRGTEDFRLAYGTAAVPALRELAPTQEAAATVPAPPPGPPPRLTQGITFERVSFRYPGQQTEILSDLTLTLPAGRSLAIVGANGAGKTTLIKLLCRLYDPTSGRITADGVDLRSLEPVAWRGHLSAIFQDFVQYPLTLRENVAFGGIAASSADAARLADVARRTGAIQLLETLPRGWETVLSRQFAGGAELSGGQWQQVALARALFGAHAGADVLILDEPTANLDVRAEAALYERFLDITQGLTTVLISHRFSTVRRAHRIVVLEHGRITEEGTHDELLALGGAYARMFSLQASRFTPSSQSAEPVRA